MISGFSSVVLVASMAVSPAIPAVGIDASSIKSSITTLVVNEGGVQPQLRAPAAARRVSPQPRGAGKIAGGALLGAFAGFWAGGFVGYKLERKFADCNCDDPGLRGILIGVPIGTLAGAILGGKFLFR